MTIPKQNDDVESLRRQLDAERATTNELRDELVAIRRAFRELQLILMSLLHWVETKAKQLGAERDGQ